MGHVFFGCQGLVDVEEQALAALWTRADDDKSGELGRASSRMRL